MADKKISALTSATTPLAGTEVLPIVQSGATVKVAVSDLTAGRAISATSVTASTGNFVVGTSGQGIDFSATSGSGTSELLADYEEGTWSPTMSASSSGTITMNGTYTSGKYTKVGRMVVCTASLYVGSVSSPTGNLYINGLPFTVGTPSSAACGWYVGLTAAANNCLVFRVDNSSTSILTQGFALGTTSAAAGWVQAGTEMNLTITYFV